MSASGAYLKEGNTYRFLIKNVVEMSFMETFYVLQDEKGSKQLLKTEYYDKYNLQIGQYINCRIDHINCTGRIFLEPEHPYYKEGEVYDFVIEEIEYLFDKFGNNLYEVKVKDIFDEIAFCRIEQKLPVFYSKGHSVKCKVERVKKGALYLSSMDNNSHEDFLRNTWYPFKITDIRVLNDGIRYFVLDNKNGKHFLLKHDYYPFHGFKPGDEIECEVQKMNSDGYYVLEPKHPYYKLNNNYTFECIKTIPDISSAITQKIEVTVKDHFGQEVKFLSDDPFFKGNNQPGKIICEVIGLKKGKPLLCFISKS